MKPYYERDDITIYHGDCREVLPLLAADAVDVVITDPPYGDTSLEWDARVSGWLPLIEPLLNASGSLWLFGSLRSFLAQADDFAGWRFAQDIVWEKHNGSNFHADRFNRVHEQAAQFYPKGRAWSEVHHTPVTTPDATRRVGRRKERPQHHLGQRGPSEYVSRDGGPRLMRSVIKVRSTHGYAEHPTQKPTGIVSPLVEYSCPSGGLVLDPFMGSGTTLRAAKDLGRKAIGIEIEERYCEIAAQRLSQEVLL